VKGEGLLILRQVGVLSSSFLLMDLDEYGCCLSSRYGLKDWTDSESLESASNLSGSIGSIVGPLCSSTNEVGRSGL
jgi:hypothetical protein